MGNQLASLRADFGKTGTFTFTIEGRLDSSTTGKIWLEAIETLARVSPAGMIIDASQIDYCDVSGIGLLVELHRRQQKAGKSFDIIGLRPEYEKILTLFKPSEFDKALGQKPAKRHFIEEMGRAIFFIWKDIQTVITFIGELGVALLSASLHPFRVRWKDASLTAETAGVNALPVIALVSFLIGLIMAFQAAIPMRQFGVEIFVADLVALSMLRELGPLMTAIVLTGRSGSAFAAELGTMKVDEEIDALTTMGLEPVAFLAVPKVIAALVMTPILTIFANLFGLIGGAIVLLSLGYPLITYVNQVIASVTCLDMMGGLLKSFVFGILVAGVGCLRGLQTKIGPSAVGESTTRAVVSGIILIAVTDGLFAVIYYYLGI